MAQELERDPGEINLEILRILEPPKKKVPNNCPKTVILLFNLFNV